MSARYARAPDGRFRKARWWEIFTPAMRRDPKTGRFVKRPEWMPDRVTALVVGAMFAAFAIAVFAAGAHR